MAGAITRWSATIPATASPTVTTAGYEWNSCTDHSLYRAPNCSLYNSANCTEQVSTTGVNVYGTKTVDIPVRCPIDTNSDGVPDQGGCKDVQVYASGTNFMSLYVAKRAP